VADAGRDLYYISIYIYRKRRIVTVAELIKKLKMHRLDAEVVISSDGAELPSYITSVHTRDQNPTTKLKRVAGVNYADLPKPQVQINVSVF